ncbi:class I SAM-dependent methyltransferase [Limnoglobus roseus]|uniref:class I SAM-dependent methyltransferase n=1 Tax=Limnoglobus roseus TaxID=2598579 RepID=UPI00143D957E|nr:class I SAM-dependent methyltransferase [Limnoglobus roseus]
MSDSDTANTSGACQAAFHAAFRDDLFAIVDALPGVAGGTVLDVPCGDGFYARRLAARAGARGHVTAVDADGTALGRARRALRGAGNATVRAADAYRLPFPDAAFDVAWSAESLVSLDPARAVGEMARVVRPGGVVAVLEVDEFHHVVLPWPSAVEVSLPAAVRAAAAARYGDGEGASPARRLRAVLRTAGLGPVHRRTYPFDRAAPFDGRTAAFVGRHFAFLRAFAYPHLPPDARAAFDRATDPDGADALLRRPDVDLVCLSAVYLAGRGTGRASTRPASPTAAVRDPRRADHSRTAPVNTRPEHT